MGWRTRKYGLCFGAGVASLVIPTVASGQAWSGWTELGVEVVASGPPAVGPTPWSLEGPTLTIGLVDGPEPYLFTHVWDAERTSDGRIVVVDDGSHEIRTFGPGGRHLGTFGGRGGGPEEFGGPPWISLDGDELVVWDPGHYRLSRYSLDGELLEQETLRERGLGLDIFPFPNGLVWETSVAGMLWTGPDLGGPRDEGRRTEHMRLVWIGPEESHDFGAFRRGETYAIRSPEGGFRGFSNAFAPASVAAVADDGRVAISEGELGRILIMGPDHGPRRVVVAEIGRHPVTEEMVAEQREDLPRLSEGLRIPLRRLEDAFDELPVPDSVPVVADLVWSDPGELWVGRRAGELRSIDAYHVFGSDGRWMARVSVPGGMGRVMDIGEDHLLAGRRDELGVEYLDLYSIVRE